MTTTAGVHASHCCKNHGCKYGDDLECPVVLGTVSANAPCEDCAEVWEYERTWQNALASYEDSALFIHGDDRDGTDEL